MGKQVLLIVSGGIAAYKTPDLVRRLRDGGMSVRCVVTRGGGEFVAPSTLAVLSGEKVYSELFEESGIDHIRLAREADMVLVAPATAHIIARMAAGLADDLATTVLLATGAPVVVAPAMNGMMWEHAATRANVETLKSRGIHFIGPDAGDLACGETGEGRMKEPGEIASIVSSMLNGGNRLKGRRALVTSGPTFEPMDPVRFIGNRSSGRQGHAVAGALARMGAETLLVSGPTAEPDPTGVRVVRVETACEMLAACEEALPVDIAVCVAAVADWRPTETAGAKIKKDGSGNPPVIRLVENPDILKTLAGAGNLRPRLLVGFAAETGLTHEIALSKRKTKGCDWMVANDVSSGSGVFGGASNQVHFVTDAGVEDWPRMSKIDVAAKLAEHIATALGET